MGRVAAGQGLAWRPPETPTVEVNDWSAAQGAGVRAHRFLGRGVLCRRCCRRRTGVSHDSFGVKLRTSQTRGIHVRKASKQNTAKKRKSPLNWDPVWRAVEAPLHRRGATGLPVRWRCGAARRPSCEHRAVSWRPSSHPPH